MKENGKALGKGEFVKKNADKHEMSQMNYDKALKMVLGDIEAELVEGNAVNFTGFGKFDVVERAAREGHNPQTNAPIQIPACKSPRFSAGKTLKDIVNK